MEKEDGRKLAAEAQFERRKQAVRLHKQGKTPEQIAEMLGMGHVTARSAIKIAEADGIKALAPKKRGRPSGSCRQLSEEQEAHIQRLICEKRPEQMKMDFALWTRAAVMALIKQELAIELPVRTVGEYLKRWGFTPQKAHPARLRATPRSSEAMAGRNLS
jgi:transposase